MKLSDIKGDRCLDVISDLVAPIANIAMDESAAGLFKREPCPEGEDPRKVAAERLKAGLPALLKAHKPDLIAILATIKGVEEERYAEDMTLLGLIADLTELLTDDAFLELFT